MKNVIKRSTNDIQARALIDLGNIKEGARIHVYKKDERWIAEDREGNRARLFPETLRNDEIIEIYFQRTI